MVHTHRCVKHGHVWAQGHKLPVPLAHCGPGGFCHPRLRYPKVCAKPSCLVFLFLLFTLGEIMVL